MKSNKTKSAVTALVVAAMLCSVTLPIKAVESQWVNNDGLWSYVKNDNSLATGWLEDGDCWYVFDENGIMRTGWIASHEHWYFMGESGVMQVDAWVEDNGSLYYLKGTGVMAKDYVKDGYELTGDGKAIPLAESNSIVVTDPNAITGEVIEGNLYVDVTAAKEIELSKVIIKGKLVVLGDNETVGKVVLKDSIVDTISNQTRNTEVVLSGETKVKAIVLEETALVTPDKNFNGEVETIEVQSTTKDEIKIEVPTQEVTTRTYASIDIQAPVENLEVITDTQIKVNADVKNVVVTKTAKDTKVEVAKGSTIGTLTADASVKIDGNGTVNKVEVNADGVEAGKDTIIKDVDKADGVEKAPEVNKPSTGGSSGGGGYVPPVVEKGVKNEAELKEALSKLKNGGEILIGKDFEAAGTIIITNADIPSGVWEFVINGQGNTIDLKMPENETESVLYFDKTDPLVDITLKNIKLTGGNAGIHVDSSCIILDGSVDLSGNTIGGVRVSGEDEYNAAKITINENARLLQDEKEKDGKPFLWLDNKDVVAKIFDNSKTLTAKTITKDGHDQTHYFFRSFYEVKNLEELKNNLRALTVDGEIFLANDIEITDPLVFDNQSDFIPANLKSFRIDGQGNKIIYKGSNLGETTSYVLSVVDLGNVEVILSDIHLTGADTSLLVKGSKVKLDNNVDVSGNTKAGIEVAKGDNATLLDVSEESITNTSEYREVGGLGNKPTITVGVNPGINNITVKFKQFKSKFFEKVIGGNYHYYQEKTSLNISSANELVSIFNDYIEGDTVNLTDNITLNGNITLKNNITFKNSEDRTIDLNGYTITIKNGEGSLKTSGTHILEVAGPGKVIGSLYAETNGNLKVTGTKDNLSVVSSTGYAIGGNLGTNITINGGTYSSAAKGGTGVIDIKGDSILSVKNATVNVEVASVMNAYGIHSSAKTNVLDNVIVNGRYSACGDFNNEYGKTVITNSEFHTTMIADENDKKYSAPTLKYQGELEIRNSLIERVNVGILYQRPDATSVEGLTYDDTVKIESVVANDFDNIGC